MARSRTQVNSIVRRDGSMICHYCDNECKQSGKKAATRDHIVPKSMGGANSVHNYVLACADCNSKRGNDLMYCGCDFCSSVIEKWFQDNLWSFSNPGRFKIFKDEDGWNTLFNGRRNRHKSYFAAIKAMRGITASYIHNANTLGNLL